MRALFIFAISVVTILPALARAACYSHQCDVFVQISVDRKLIEVYENSRIVIRATVNPPKSEYWDFVERNKNSIVRLEGPFTGRIYSKDFVYHSSKYPVPAPRPFAIFISPTYYIYGFDNVSEDKSSRFGFRTTLEAAETVNRLVRQYGKENSWISVGH